MLESEYLPGARPEMQRYVTNSPRVTLEVGCREAFFTQALRQQHPITETWGIEPDESIREDAEKNLDHFICGLFTPDLDLPEKHFDLVVFNDVLEHTYDPWELLRYTQKLLTDDGIVVASIPNIRHKSVLKALLLKDDFTYQKAGIMDVSHIRFFTRSTMQKLFHDTGYEIETIEPVVLIKKRKFYKKLVQGLKNLLHALMFNHFKSTGYAQYAIRARVKK